ncbi:MAG TPA: ABC transporter ATP-binding protein [Pyrinomonadaceae bacterium]|jgi:ABC-2 type transport system ATP-binding protein|nr:ABC transporter ATP-binding protein [Pyrinomonadaceae bacterium]
MSVVEIENLSKDYELGFLRKRKVRALDNLSLTVEQGEIFGFLGANGAGKTTTLKLLMRLTFPTEGTARILGLDINNVSMHQRIGYLPENPYFYDYLTAREFLEYCAELFGFSSVTRRERATDLLRSVHLEEKAWNTQLRKFSKGMLQRVGLAQALINDPEVVFLDEPMSGLDPIGRREVRDLIASLRQTGKTVFMCSHILSDIEVLCDRVAILKKGKLAHIGRLNELRGQEGKANLEIIVTCTDVESLSKQLSVENDFVITETADGVRIEVPEETDVDPVIAALRRANGKLVSVQAVKQSLEELFVD